MAFLFETPHYVNFNSVYGSNATMAFKEQPKFLITGYDGNDLAGALSAGLINLPVRQVPAYIASHRGYSIDSTSLESLLWGEVASDLVRETTLLEMCNSDDAYIQQFAPARFSIGDDAAGYQPNVPAPRQNEQSSGSQFRFASAAIAFSASAANDFWQCHCARLNRASLLATPDYPSAQKEALINQRWADAMQLGKASTLMLVAEYQVARAIDKALSGFPLVGRIAPYEQAGALLADVLDKYPITKWFAEAFGPVLPTTGVAVAGQSTTVLPIPRYLLKDTYAAMQSWREGEQNPVIAYDLRSSVWQWITDLMSTLAPLVNVEALQWLSGEAAASSIGSGNWPNYAVNGASVMFTDGVFCNERATINDIVWGRVRSTETLDNARWDVRSGTPLFDASMFWTPPNTPLRQWEATATSLFAYSTTPPANDRTPYSILRGDRRSLELALRSSFAAHGIPEANVYYKSAYTLVQRNSVLVVPPRMSLTSGVLMGGQGELCSALYDTRLRLAALASGVGPGDDATADYESLRIVARDPRWGAYLWATPTGYASQGAVRKVDLSAVLPIVVMPS